MKKFVLFILPLLLFICAFKVNASLKLSESYQNDSKIEWLTFEQAIEKNKTNPKMIFIDFYTDWCSWCKKMDDNVFANPQIAEKIASDFYAIKFNAEGDQMVNFEGVDYKLDTTGRRPAHELAQKFATVNDRLGYPTFVVLDETFVSLKAFQGYKTVDRLKQILDYYGDKEIYMNKNWIEFIQEQTGEN